MWKLLKVSDIWLPTVGTRFSLILLAGCMGTAKDSNDRPQDSSVDSASDTGECEQNVYTGDLAEHFVDFCKGYCSREISGNLSLDNVSQEELAGLHCLTRVGGSLELDSNYLTHLGGLESLVSVGEDLVLTGYYLEDLSALQNLRVVGGSFGVVRTGLRELGELPSLTTVGG
ncbi:MAG TPA: hypothetical protein PKY30_09720, partial [Myxococcota bacterium]|nr:hypothetical protein [Myxococcota bacterium]